MSGDLPALYYRIRENGALVFRVRAERGAQRIGMDQIAMVNVRTGEISPRGAGVLTEAETLAIAEWLADRRAVLAEREVDDILRTVDHLNLTAHWAQSRASAEDLDRVTDALLLAMHDLRAVLVRKRAERPADGTAESDG
ncbi:hypothetical protein NHN26_13050 [Rhodovulum tesquicola]|uniref:hypothetical protein n=1 Tax=Rhodovulum tesquicola TaxID=540254 RepID=UPI002096CD74|nr:hypothetical protein [Rhodovulum tesquicola]MCO8146148.1 hypothetical protein [Rhodovulum tesquicola]